MKLINILLCLLLSTQAFSSLEEGLSIAKKMEQASEGYVGESSVMKLVLVDADGQEIVREMDGSSLELPSMNRTLMSFRKPADVKGTKLLTWAHDEKDDDQWLFLPSLSRVKRINSRTRGSAFMGSEFSFEDLGGQAIDKYNFNLLGEQSLGTETVWKLERISKSKSSYGKVILYVSKRHLNAIKVEYYNKRMELFKFSEHQDFKEYQVGKKKIYRSNKIVMTNIQNKKSSVFTWSNRKLGVSHSKRSFDKKALR